MKEPSPKLNQIVALITKGRNEGFSESHIITMLEKKGYGNIDINMALRILNEPEFANKREDKEDLEKKKILLDETKRKAHEFDNASAKKRLLKKESIFASLKDPQNLYLVILLCLLFFMLGIIVDRLFFLI